MSSGGGFQIIDGEKRIIANNKVYTYSYGRLSSLGHDNENASSITTFTYSKNIIERSNKTIYKGVNSGLSENSTVNINNY